LRRGAAPPRPAAVTKLPAHGKMTFYAQLDSINDDICIADCGMIQVFLCFDCFATKSVVQSG
jgi:hypothetical protein